MEKDQSLETDVDVSSADEAAAPIENKASSRSKKNPLKLPRKINKARREKLKREQFNDLFLDLAEALGIKEPNNGKACILTETARFLNGMLAHVDLLRKENKTLNTEYKYIKVEKDELKEDNLLLSSEIGKLRNEIYSKKLQPQSKLNAHTPQVPLVPHQSHQLSEDRLGFAIPDTSLGLTHLQYPPPFVVFQSPGIDHPLPNQNSIVRKPCPRYPDQTGTWQSQILEERLRAG